MNRGESVSLHVRVWFAALGNTTATVEPLATWNRAAAARLTPQWANLARLSWFTDLDTPTPPRALGLTRATIRCDRTAYRYRVTDDRAVVPWLGSPYRHPRLVSLLERDGALPRHWYVAPVGVAATYDPEVQG